MADPVLTIEVPGRAVPVNAAYRRGKRHVRYTKDGRPYLSPGIYMSAPAKAWKDTVSAQVYYERICTYWRDDWTPRLPLRIVCHVYGTRADADNLSKLILDGLKEGIGIDDRHFKTVEMHTTAKELKQPRTVIDVYEAEEGAEVA